MKVSEIIRGSVWFPNPRCGEEAPTVSVLMPVEAGTDGTLLAESMDAVLQQTYRSLELIVVLDGAGGEAEEVCRACMERDPRVHRIVHGERAALPAVSIYEAYRRARGSYVAFAFADTVWQPDALEKTYAFMGENGVKASCGITVLDDPDADGPRELGVKKGRINDIIWMGNPIGADSVVLHREVLERAGLPDPHLSLTDACYWDLWLRICEKYAFAATGITFARRVREPRQDTIDSAFRMDQWFFREWQQHRDPELLKPEEYPQADIAAWLPHSSCHFMECLGARYGQCAGQSWFDPAELERIRAARGCDSHLHILVICADKTASIMNFDRYAGDLLTFCYSHVGNVYHSHVAYADAAFLIRLLDGGRALELCKALSVPCYYFTDDNFRQIAEDAAADPGVRSAALHTTREELQKYEGVVVTTPALRDYFLREKLHDRVLQLPAVWAPPLLGPVEEHPFTVGFMGGPFREEVLKDCVLPALYSLSRTVPIRMIVPCTEENRDDVLALGKERLEIVPFLRTSHYRFLLEGYYAIGVDVLVHCGTDNRNTAYKTKNALINAVTLGVPLIVSDIMPYCDTSDGSEGAYLLVRNTPEDWLTGLGAVMKSKALCRELLAKAETYCRSRYSWDAAWKELAAELSRYKAPEGFVLAKRYEKICDWLMGGGIWSSGAQRRIYVPEELSFSGALSGIRRYGFTAQKRRIGTLGLLFARFGTCTGTVHLTVRSGDGRELAQASVRIEQLEFNGYTDFRLDHTITDRKGQRLFADLDIRYDAGDGHIGVFEDRKRRTFIYKVCNKLGRPIPGTDALFVDCRR